MLTRLCVLRSWWTTTLSFIFLGITLVALQGCIKQNVVCPPGGGGPQGGPVEGPAPCFSHAAQAGEKQKRHKLHSQGRVCNSPMRRVQMRSARPALVTPNSKMGNAVVYA
jgi:hypothetical protein